MPKQDIPTTRLVLVARPSLMGEAPAARLEAALAGGDVASVILAGEGETPDFQAFCAALVPVAQAAGAAAMVAGDSRIAGRVKADGLHLVDADREALDEALAKSAGRTIVGVSGGTTRHEALDMGEGGPDYVFFGVLDGDSRDEAHPLNVERAEWWASMVEIPCIAMGGSAIASVAALAETGAEFVALGRAVFEAADPAAAVAEANRLIAGDAE